MIIEHCENQRIFFIDEEQSEMGFMITTDGTPGSTQVPNEILLHYLLKANGENVKIYLYLLMASQNPGLTGQVSVETLADRLDLTERDIVRALHYWEREGLLTLMEENDYINGISLRTPEMIQASPDTTHTFIETGAPHLRVLSSEREATSEFGTDVTPTPVENEVPQRINYSPMQIEALSKDVEMQQTLSHIEQALGAPLTPAHMQLVMYLICDLSFSGDLICYLYDLAAERQKTKPRYIETIAIEWKKKGIRSVVEARAEAADFAGKYRTIAKALGIHRDFAPAEREIVDSWDDYHFSDEILGEACKRTVLQTGDTNLNYVSSILAGWARQGVKTMDDIARADEAFQKSKKAHAKPAQPRKRITGTSFQNFRGRDYTDEDYEDMERQFLQKRKGTP